LSVFTSAISAISLTDRALVPYNHSSRFLRWAEIVNDIHRTLVLGGSGSLGRVVCTTLAELGSRVAFTYRTGRAVADELTARLPETRAWALDLTSVPDIGRVIDAAADALGGLDALVHCAALGLTPGDPIGDCPRQRLEDVSAAGWDGLMAVNVRSAFFACQAAVPHLTRAGGGNVVLVGSVDGVKPVPSPIPYCTSKAALVGMAQALAKELGKDGIRVNVVAPGILEGGLSRTLPKPLLDEYLRHCGLKRLGRAAEAANLIAWLARHNTYVTAQTIVLDGAL
jgi:NAD(P)-dependent dehydrogenase (short-subunit alcohol dehydrogenase family)